MKKGNRFVALLSSLLMVATLMTVMPASAEELGSGDVPVVEETAASPAPPDSSNASDPSATPDGSADASVTSDGSADAQGGEPSVEPSDEPSDEQDAAAGDQQLEATTAVVPTAVSVRAHVQNIGWQDAVTDGGMAGTQGKALRVEGFNFALVLSDGTTDASAITAQAHVQNVGWQNPVSNGGLVGTQGQSLRVEAIKLSLSSAYTAQGYHIYYRVHVQNYGWTAWAKDGELAGTQGQSLRLEAIQVQVLPEGASPDNKDLPAPAVSWAFRDNPTVSYQAHVQNIGWQRSRTNGAVAGTTGRSLRVEALQLSVSGSQYSGGIEYQAHVQNVGWQDWCSNGALAGTTGRSLRVEAVRIKLAGEVAQHYDLYYRMHVQNIGWLAWTSNGATAGTEGMARRVEAIQVCLVAKGGAAPSASGQASSNAFIKTPSVTYSANVQGSGWQSVQADGATAGTTGQGLPIEQIAASLSMPSEGALDGGLSYQANIQGDGWSGWKQDNDSAGTPGKAVTAVQMKLTGAAAGQFDVWYRVHLQNVGWLGWASDGQTAGSGNTNNHVEAIQVVIRAKGAGAPGSTANHEYVYVYINVPYVNQISAGTPLSCEPSSLWMCMRGAGQIANVSHAQFIAGVPIARDGNPSNGFSGSPYRYVRGTYNGILASPLAAYGNRLGRVRNITGTSVDGLISELRAGHPCAVWVTKDFAAPSASYKWGTATVSPGHTMALIGYDSSRDAFCVADPYRSVYWVSASAFARSYNPMKMAIAAG